MVLGFESLILTLRNDSIKMLTTHSLIETEGEGEYLAAHFMRRMIDENNVC